MSDGITDDTRMTRKDIEIWRERTKQEFIHNLTTAELVEALCKREGVTNYRENYPTVKHTIIVVRE